MNKENVESNNCNVDKKKGIVIFSIIFSICMVISLVVFGSVYVYQSFYFKNQQSSLEISKFTIFHNEFDKSTQTWLIGVVSENSEIAGSFSCAKKPLNNNPELYYIIDYLTTLSGKTKKSYDFKNLINCYKIVKLPELGYGRQVKL